MSKEAGRCPDGPGYSPSGLSQSSLSQAQPSIPNADDDPIVGHKTWADGSHTPVRQREAEEIWAKAEAAQAKRAADMPTEQDAINQLWDAQERLKQLGWKDPVYAPKDGSALDVIELGSTGIHRAYYEGKWPTGGWWLHDGDVWPCRPALARPAIADGSPEGRDSATGSISEADDSAVAKPIAQTPVRNHNE